MKEKRSKYEPFGNFNYGAAGAAAGFTEGQLLRMARHYQTDKTYAAGEDPGLLRSILGTGGLAPYGDEPADQDQILNGQIGFPANYVAEFTNNMRKGMDKKDAEQNISFELEAAREAANIKEAIRNQYGEDPCSKHKP